MTVGEGIEAMMRTDTVGYIGTQAEGDAYAVGVTEVADRLLRSHFDPARFRAICDEARACGMDVGKAPSEHPVVRLPDSCCWGYGAVVATADAAAWDLNMEVLEGDRLCAVQVVNPKDDPCWGAVVPVVMDASLSEIRSMGGPWFACPTIGSWTDPRTPFECGPFARDDDPWDGLENEATLASLEEWWCGVDEQPRPSEVAPGPTTPIHRLSVPFSDATIRYRENGSPAMVDRAVANVAAWPPMGTFRYTEPGFTAYLAVDGPEMDSATAFQTLARDVFRDALARCGVDPDAASDLTFGNGVMNALIGEPCEYLCDVIWGCEGCRHQDDFGNAVTDALTARGASVGNLGYFYHPDEVDVVAARERDHAAEVYRGAVAIEDFRLTDASMTVVEPRCPSTVADAARSAAGNQGAARLTEPAHRI